MKARKVLFTVLVVLVLASLACTLDVGGGKVYNFGATATSVPTEKPVPTPIPTIEFVVPTPVVPIPVAPTPKPAQPLAIPGIDAPVEVLGVDLTFVSLTWEDSFLMADGQIQYPLNPNERFIRIRATSMRGGYTIVDWPMGSIGDSVHIIDDKGVWWYWFISDIPQLEGSAMVGWIFSVPGDTVPVTIVLPGGVEVPLAPLQ